MGTGDAEELGGTLRADRSPRSLSLVVNAHLLTNEQLLIASIRAGDQAAFEALFGTYYQSLCAFVARYVESHAVAEEIVQDVFVNVWHHRATWDVRGSLRGYLFGAARNGALSACKHQAVADRWTASATMACRAGDVAAGAVGGDAALPDELMRDAELNAAVAAAINQMPRRRREAYLLRWQHRYSHADIARQMGISIKGVERQLALALKDLRSALSDIL